MKKHLKSVLLIVILIILVCTYMIGIRNDHYQTGKSQGYLTGYSIGYADGLNGLEQDPQILGGTIVPYEYGNSLWKGFMMGFTSGYDDGLAHGNGVK